MSEPKEARSQNIKEPEFIVEARVKARAVRWVLLADVGQAVIRDDVPPEQVVNTLEDLAGSSGKGNQTKISD